MLSRRKAIAGKRKRAKQKPGSEDLAITTLLPFYRITFKVYFDLIGR